MHYPASGRRSAFYQVYEQADYGRSYKTEAGMGAMWEREDSKAQVLYQ